MKKIVFVALVWVVVCVPAYRVNAKIVFTELMYDPSSSDTGHEWVEIYNDSIDPVTLVGGSGTGSWRFNDGSNHYLATSTISGGMTLPGGEYAILADNGNTFLSDYPSFSGTVIDTIVGLTNASGTAKIIDGAGNTLDTVSYTKDQGGYDDGSSLQKKSDGTWVAGAPTPGSATQDTNTVPINDTNSQTSGGGSAVATTTTVVSFKPQISLTIPKISIAGVAVTFSLGVLNISAISSYNKTFHVALGDGTENNSSTASNFSHIYKYPGTYVVNFLYQPNQYEDKQNLSVRRVIEIVSPQMVISGLEKDGAIKITNESKIETDLSLWQIRSIVDPNHSFYFPQNTTVLPGKTITLSSEVTGISPENAKKLYLALPVGDIVSVFTDENLQ